MGASLLALAKFIYYVICGIGSFRWNHISDVDLNYAWR